MGEGESSSDGGPLGRQAVRETRGAADHRRLTPTIIAPVTRRPIRLVRNGRASCTFRKDLPYPACDNGAPASLGLEYDADGRRPRYRSGMIHDDWFVERITRHVLDRFSR